MLKIGKDEVYVKVEVYAKVIYNLEIKLQTPVVMEEFKIKIEKVIIGDYFKSLED